LLEAAVPIFEAPRDEAGTIIAVTTLGFASPATIGDDVPFSCGFVSLLHRQRRESPLAL
jgi:hypothetical protein